MNNTGKSAWIQLETDTTIIRELKNKTEKVCQCGRIITDPNNKTGLCPKCQKNANSVAAEIGLAVILVGAKKYGPKLVKSTLKLIKKR